MGMRVSVERVGVRVGEWLRERVLMKYRMC